MAGTKRSVESKSKKGTTRPKQSKVKNEEEAASQVTLSDLLLAAKQYWSEGSLYDQAVEAERTGSLKQMNCNAVSHKVGLILRQTSQSLLLCVLKGIRSVEQWSDVFEYEEHDEERPDDEDSYAEIAIYNVLTTDTGMVRVAVYQDLEKSSIDRIPDNARLPAACRLWRDRWGNESMPSWVYGIADCDF